MAHQEIRATLWVPLEELTISDVEDMLRAARMLGASDSNAIWVNDSSGSDVDDGCDDDRDRTLPDRLYVGVIVTRRPGGV